MNPATRLLLFGGQWSPARLFALGGQGAWWDPSDVSTLFQDSAGTTPVTATTQPVGKILDKSGRGNHLIQATASARPTWQQDASGFYYLATDGVDDALASSGNVSFAATQIGTAFLGLRKNADTNGTAMGLGSSLGTAGTLDILTMAAGIQFRMYGANAPSSDARVTAELAPQMKVISCVFNNSVDAGAALTILPRENGAIPSLTTTSDTATQPQALANAALQLGGAPGQFANSRIYGAIMLGRLATAIEIAQAERYIGAKMGIPL